MITSRLTMARSTTQEAQSSGSRETERAMLFKTVEIEGLKIFYREAGKPGSPKLVLLHGFPASSHQYRNLKRLPADLNRWDS